MLHNTANTTRQKEKPEAERERKEGECYSASESETLIASACEDDCDELRAVRQ